MSLPTGIAVLCAVLLFFCIVIVRDTHRFVIRRYEIVSEKLPQDLTVCLLSDLHGKDYGNGNEALLAAIDAEAPDLILSAGDLVTASDTKERFETETAVSLIDALCKRYPVYGANGNHEDKMTRYPGLARMYAPYEAQLKDAGMHLLHNAQATLGKWNLLITGLEADRRYYRRLGGAEMRERYIDETCGTADPSCFNILIAHNPDYFPTYAAWGADLTVSGHVHGGIMRLPAFGGVIAPSLRLFPKYDGGCFTIKEETASTPDGSPGNGAKTVSAPDGPTHTMILSRGLGTHSIHVRVFNPGELVMIRLKRADG